MLKTNYNKTELTNFILSALIIIMVLLLSTTALLEWYVNPVLNGLNLVNAHIDFDYLEITGFDERVEEMTEEFREEFIAITNDESLSVEEAVAVLQLKLEDYEEEMFKEFYGVVLYQFAPLVTLPAVFYLHMRFWVWVSLKIIKLTKIKNEKPIRIWYEK